MLKKALSMQNLVLFLVFFAALAVSEAAGFGPATTAARIRAKI